VKPANKTVRTTFSLPEQQYKVIQAMAEKHGLSVAWLMRQAISEFLEESDQFTPLSSEQNRDKRL
jgi:predicted DNA-binding ribbon-helix-helix protein